MSQIGRLPEGEDEEQVQRSAEQIVELCWRHPERYLGNQDFWECTVMNFARQINCYLVEICSQEGMEALILNKVHTHISTLVIGMQGPEKERAESQRFWMGKWGEF